MCFLFNKGNTVVCKPSEITSVTAWMLCKLMEDAGLPSGVVNIVFGTGPKAGEALINHRDVNVINRLTHNFVSLFYWDIFANVCDGRFYRLYLLLDLQMLDDT